MATSNELGDDQVATLHQYPVITPCDLCDTKEDVNSFCRNCSQNLCDGCKRTHSKCTVTRDHNVVHISEGKSSDSEDTTCTKHGERLFFYCRTCSVLFCPKCLNPTHKNHDVLDTDEYAKELQNYVALMIEEKSRKVEESRRNEEDIEERKKKYVDACTNNKTSVMTATKRLHAEVDLIEAEFLSKISQHESQGLSKFDEAKRQEKTKGKRYQESLEKLIRHSKKHDNMSLVSYASKLSVEDRHMAKYNDDTELESISTVDFKSVKGSTKNVISEIFGTLCISHALTPRKHDAKSEKKSLKTTRTMEQKYTTYQKGPRPTEIISEPKVVRICSCTRPVPNFSFECEHCGHLILDLNAA